jgi:hypothetical protein
MELRERIQKESREIYQNFRSLGITFEITPENRLRILAKTTPEQFEVIRKWKRWIAEQICPHCSNCNLAMKLIENGKLWFCPLGCESRKAR